MNVDYYVRWYLLFEFDSQCEFFIASPNIPSVSSQIKVKDIHFVVLRETDLLIDLRL